MTPEEYADSICKWSNTGLRELVIEAIAAAAQAERDMQQALITALEPFAKCAEVWTDEDADRVIYWARIEMGSKDNLGITVADLLNARDAIRARSEAK